MSNPTTTIEHVPAADTSRLRQVWRRLLWALVTSRRRQAERTIADYRAMLGEPGPTAGVKRPTSETAVRR
jgi:hypothetical protein